jgi:pyrroline-5-carboxylate reductase
MPSITASVGAGAAAICGGKYATDEHLGITQELFTSVGKAIVMEEKLLDAVTGLSGSGPAFVSLFIEALADAGVQVGLSRQDATTLAVQTVLGASKMVEQTGEHPAILKNRVTSPGGTTAAGLYELESGGLRIAIANAVIAATKRSTELAT